MRSISLATKLRVSCFTLIDGFDSPSGTIEAIFVKELNVDGDRLVTLTLYSCLDYIEASSYTDA